MSVMNDGSVVGLIAVDGLVAAEIHEVLRARSGAALVNRYNACQADGGCGAAAGVQRAYSADAGYRAGFLRRSTQQNQVCSSTAVGGQGPAYDLRPSRRIRNHIEAVAVQVNVLTNKITSGGGTAKNTQRAT